MDKDCIQLPATVNIRLDRRRILKSGRYPTKLYLYSGKEPFCMGMTPRIELTPEEWIKIKSPRLQDTELKLVKNELASREVRAKDLVKILGENFTFKTFATLYKNKKKVIAGASKNVYKAFERHIDILEAEQRTGYMESYIDAMESLRAFRKKLTFEEVTLEFLQKYESYMLAKENSLTTVGIYLRNLRRIVNIARKEKVTDVYAFADYKIPSGSNVKKSLDEDILIKFINYKTEDTTAAWAHDMWCFSFFCNGMNMTDIFNLKGENIFKDRIVFQRKKTERTKKKNDEPVTVYITKPIKMILEKYAKIEDGKEHIFDLLDNNMSLSAKYYAIKNAIRRINYHNKKITRDLRTDKITTYVARHSWATTLMREGASVAYISKGLGHSSLQTTENYLAGFTSKQQISMANKLLRLCKF